MYYKAPEILLQNFEYNIAVDIWSLGCIFAELFIGNTLFRGKNPDEILYDIYIKLGHADFMGFLDEECPSDHEFEGSGFQYIRQHNGDFDAQCEDLLGFILQMDPLDRPNCEEILRHVYFDEVERKSGQMESLGEMLRETVLVRRGE